MDGERKFLAAIQGIDLDKNEGVDDQQARFDEVRRRAAAKQSGLSEEQIFFGEIGITVIDEDT